MSQQPLLEVKNLSVRFPVWGGVLRRRVNDVLAVDDVSFTLNRGEVLGMVGESGCGKSTTAKAICNVLRETAPGVRVDGQIIYHSERGPIDLLSLRGGKMKPYRSEIQMIFQDPFSSLNPRMTVGEIIERPLLIHTRKKGDERRRDVVTLLDKVGLQADAVHRYPHEFSGGQRQRIGIARALAVRPRLIIADEPVSALDVSVQSQVINLMQDLQDEFQLTYLFVAHDLSVVYHISDRIAVMYLGNLVEIGAAATVYETPMHPYTRVLLSAVPQPDPHSDRTRRVKLEGEIPSPLQKPPGCAFHPRCPMVQPDCSSYVPPLLPKDPGQFAACPYTSQSEAEPVATVPLRKA